MASFNTKDIENIYQGGGVVYYANSSGNMVKLGLLHEDGIEGTVMENITGVGSALTGEGKVAYFTSGTDIEITLKLRDFDKYYIQTIFQSVTATGTNSTDGTLGSMTFGRDAGYRYTGRRLVIFPHWTSAAGTQYGDDSSNPFGLEIYKAVCTTDLKFAFKPDSPTDLEVTFNAILDPSKDNGNYLGKIGFITL